jgi:hypothetical protein
MWPFKFNLRRRYSEAGYKRESRVRYKSGKNAAAAAAAAASSATASNRGRRGEGKGGGEKGDDGLRVTRVPKVGVQRMEAKLETKSHRRQSRRSRNMETADLGKEESLVYDEDEEWREDKELGQSIEKED